MIEWDLTEFVLTGMVSYGPWVLTLVLFLGTLGVFLPGTVFVLAAGAFLRQGVFAGWVFPFALLAAVLGDILSFGMGVFFRDWVGSHIETSPALRRVRSLFHERCGLAVVLTRFALTPLAVPVNWISGGTGYPFRRFLLFAIAGEMIWLMLYGTLGYVFASHWTQVGELLNNVFGVLVGLVIVAGGIGLMVHHRRQLPQDSD